MARGGILFMDAAVQASPVGRLVGASLAVIMEWSERELNLLVTVSQDQESSEGTAIPSSLVLEVRELCVFSGPSSRRDWCSPNSVWISEAMVASSASL
eukprot:14389626-Heterocapsa_arctica.AAC.1